jgi:hypothetical protein
MRAGLFLLAAALAGCKPDNGGAPDGNSAIDLTARVAPGAVVNVFTASWSAPPGSSSWVEYGLDAFDKKTPATTDEQPEIMVLGLKSSHSYRWRAVSQTPDGVRHVTPEQSYAVGPPPFGLPPVTFQYDDRESSAIAGRYILVQLGGLDQSWAVILDSDGDYVWALAFPEGLQISHVSVALDHQSLWIAQMDRDQVQDLSRVFRYSLDGTQLSDTRMPDQHHVFVERPDTGELMWPAHIVRELNQDGNTWQVLSDEVRVAKEGDGDDYRVLFNYLDDWIPFYVQCTHVEEPEPYLGEDGYHEWTHTNSLIEAPDENAFYVTPRLHDALLKFDATEPATGEHETPIWQFGGRDSDFTVAPDPALDPDPEYPDSLWSHGHMNDIWPTGFLMFDNAIHPSTHGSRALEFSMDQDKKTAELVWSYEDPSHGEMPLLGDVRRLPNGNRLITWTTFGAMDEHTLDGDTVWSAYYLMGTVIGRPTILEDLYGLVEAAKE